MNYFKYLYMLTFLVASACSPQAQLTKGENLQRFKEVVFPSTLEPVDKTKDEWKKELTEFEYYVLRDKGTERSFSGDFWDNKKSGTYLCGGCGLPLFSSETKYRSGTGWPSFYEPVNEDFIKEDQDRDLGYVRTEVLCARCDGHLGHVFGDGPAPTGLRYCINSISLDFVEKKDDN